METGSRITIITRVQQLRRPFIHFFIIIVAHLMSVCIWTASSHTLYMSWRPCSIEQLNSGTTLWDLLSAHVIASYTRRYLSMFICSWRVRVGLDYPLAIDEEEAYIHCSLWVPLCNWITAHKQIQLKLLFQSLGVISSTKGVSLCTRPPCRRMGRVRNLDLVFQWRWFCCRYGASLTYRCPTFLLLPSQQQRWIQWMNHGFPSLCEIPNKIISRTASWRGFLEFIAHSISGRQK